MFSTYYSERIQCGYGVSWLIFIALLQSLEYTLPTQSSTSTASRQTSSEDISDTLNRLLLIESAPNETVFDWIDVNVTAEKRAESGFIRSLTQTVAKACISK